MNAADVMSRNVIGISADAPLSQAVRLMIDHRISGLPVLDATGRPTGMLTEGDLLRRVETGTDGPRAGWLSIIFTPGRLAGDYVHTHGRHVADVMTPDVVSVPETMPLPELSVLMRARRIKRFRSRAMAWSWVSSAAPTWSAVLPRKLEQAARSAARRRHLRCPGRDWIGNLGASTFSYHCCHRWRSGDRWGCFRRARTRRVAGGGRERARREAGGKPAGLRGTELRDPDRRPEGEMAQ